VSLKYSLTFLALAVACVVFARALWDTVDWFGAAFLYPAVSFLLLSVAYAGVGPRLLLKRPCGRRSIMAWIWLGPYFLLNALTFGLYRMMSREPAYVQVSPNVYFGRRLSASESAAVQWESVLDLAGEFVETRRLREVPGYKSLPVLDATAPNTEQLRSAVAWVAEGAATGPVYVHCALGHGRSACVVIAYLLSVGVVSTVAEGVRLLGSLRPGVRLQPAQWEQLRVFESQPRQRPVPRPD
jgi:protein-tyrosine phosphatase